MRGIIHPYRTLFPAATFSIGPAPSLACGRVGGVGGNTGRGGRQRRTVRERGASGGAVVSEE
jgi:hypothetical protein